MVCRVAVAGFRHATNTFSPVYTTYEDFALDERRASPSLVRGDDLAPTVAGMNLPVEGFLRAAGVVAPSRATEIVPLLWCCAESSGVITRHAFDAITDELCSLLASNHGCAGGCAPVDGVYLDLHGAMVVDGFLDGEVEVVRRVRTVIGEIVPIVCSLDRHANVSEDLVILTDGLIISRSHSHVGIASTGARAFELLAFAMEGLPVQKEWREVPFLIPLAAQCSVEEPCAALLAHFHALVEGAACGMKGERLLCSVDFAPGFPLADVPCNHPSLVAYGRDATVVEDAIEDMLDAVMSSEAAFANAGALVSVQQAIRQALWVKPRRGPIVFADVHDNPAAGSFSDTTTILRAIVQEAPEAKAVVAVIADCAVAAAAIAAGVGTSFVGLPAGATASEPPSEGLKLEVMAVGNGRFLCTSDKMRGMRANLGPVALLRVEGTSVRAVVAASRFEACDQAVLRHVGVEPETEDILVLKSTADFRVEFDPVAASTLLLDSPGMNPSRLAAVPYCQLLPGLRLCPLGVKAPLARKRKAEGDLPFDEKLEFVVVGTVEFSDDDTSS